MAKDPVCGMDVDPKTAAGESEYQGQKYYFCSTGCKKAFDKEPRQYRPFCLFLLRLCGALLFGTSQGKIFSMNESKKFIPAGNVV